MSKIKEINILTTDRNWWKLMVNDISAAKDETIANVILAQKSVSAGIWIEADDADDTDYIGEQMCINTANIIAIEVVRESEEEAEQ